MRIYELEGKRTEDGKYHMQANQKEKKIVVHRKIAGAQSPITSVLVCRNAPRNEIKRRYFKFKRLKICEFIKIYIHFHFSVLYASPEHS